MNKTLLLLMCFCSVQIGYSQIQSGKVVYKIDPPLVERLIDTASVDAPKQSKEYAIKYIEKQLRVIPYLELELHFTPYESLFQAESFLTNDNTLDLKGALGATNTQGIYYNNLKENKYVHQRFDLPKTYLVTSDLDTLEWEIHDETKEIQGYTCIKATTNIIGSARNFPTTVWFAPDLPFPFGPKEFRGLPGLILAMDYNHYYFYAASIDLNTKSGSIKRPTRGVTIDNEAFQRKVSAYFGSIAPHK